jgi:phosphorylcholine metabolism protein LicD
MSLNQTKIFLKKNLSPRVYNILQKKFYYILTLNLRFKFFNLENIFFIPTRHLICINIYSELTKIFLKNKINFFLFSGLLLGAVRQGAFAGRPKDLDIGILEDDFFKLLNIKTQIKKKFSLQIAKDKDKKKRKFLVEKKNFLMRIHGILVDIFIFKKIKKNNVKYWKCLNPDISNAYLFPYEDLIQLKRINIYGKLPVNIPRNAKNFLKYKYGSNWKNPLTTKDSKNFYYL